jgi:hypothetical protein
MDQTAIQSGMSIKTPGPQMSAAEQPVSRRAQKPWLVRVIEPVASLRLTVVLFVLSFFLVFFGTWAQKEGGIWTVVNDYFRSAFVWIPLRIITMYSVNFGTMEHPKYIEGAIPYPGGWLLGSLLLVNLLAAHAIRFKFSWKRSGILLIHGGLILMMLGEVVTGVFAVEGRMSIIESMTSDHVDHERSTELAIIDRSDPKLDKEVLVPGAMLTPKASISNEQLPFDIEVIAYMANSDIQPVRAGDTNPGTAGVARTKIAVNKPETTGVDPDQSVELPAAYVKFTEKGTGKDLGTYLVSSWFSVLQRPMDEVTVGGKKYSVALRAQREYRNYRIELLEFRHDKFIGTDIPKNYSSKVRLIDPENKVDREVLISMNNPLRYEGETFYQSGLHPLAKGTVLQVVRNPGWLLPYFSCFFVTLGMIVHFGMHLREFLRRRFGA